MSSELKQSNAKQPVAMWIDAGNGWIPSRGSTAIIGGFDVSGEHLYVGRSDHQGNLIPGKINQSHGVCYICDHQLEFAKNNYQVLVQLSEGDTEFEWVEDSNGNVPLNAIQGGFETNSDNTNQDKFYIGRVKHENTLTIGKVHPQTGRI